MLNVIRNFLWGPQTVFLIALTGIVLMIRTKFRALKRPHKLLKDTLFSGNSSSFKSMCTALGGTIGVGNTVGVAAAIVEGGPGAVFWMVMAGFFGMVIKESEIFLSIKFKPQGNSFSGPMYYIESGIKNKAFAVLWAVSCIFVSLGMGNIAQSMAASESVKVVFDIPQVISACLFSSLLYAVLKGGLSRITNFVSCLIPFISVLFVLFSLGIVFIQRENLSVAVKSVFSSVFFFDSGVIGIKWALFSSAIRAGFSRGIFSNEAGLGSASIVHSASGEVSCEKQARWGVLEVFIDTVIICTLTALVILTSDTALACPPQSMTLSVFVNALGNTGGRFYAVSMFLFAFASVLAWYYYATCALEYIGFGDGVKKIFRVVFCLSSFAGAVIKAEEILIISDVFNALMLLINTSALLILSKETKTV